MSKVMFLTGGRLHQILKSYYKCLPYSHLINYIIRKFITIYNLF